MHDILKVVQVHMPFHFLHKGFLPMVMKERINPEISFNHYTLDRFKKDDYIRIADRFRCQMTVLHRHHGLKPGAG